MYKVLGLLGTHAILALVVACSAKNACGNDVLENYDYVTKEWITGSVGNYSPLFYTGRVGDRYNREEFTYHESAPVRSTRMWGMRVSQAHFSTRLTIRYLRDIKACQNPNSIDEPAVYCAPETESANPLGTRSLS